MVQFFLLGEVRVNPHCVQIIKDLVSYHALLTGYIWIRTTINILNESRCLISGPFSGDFTFVGNGGGSNNILGGYIANFKLGDPVS